MSAKEIALSISGMLPGWLSSLALSALFLAAWLNPDWFGWDGAHGLHTLVFIEVITVFGLLFMTGGRDEPLAWLPVIPIAVVLGYVIALRVGIFFGVALGVHLLSRVGSLWTDLEAVRLAMFELLSSVVLMGVAWLAVGLLPLPQLAWTGTAVPVDLWWEVDNWQGSTTRVPHALPAWGCLYFTMLAFTERAGLPARVFQGNRRWFD